jgi:hypothetical protein
MTLLRLINDSLLVQNSSFFKWKKIRKRLFFRFQVREREDKGGGGRVTFNFTVNGTSIMAYLM